MKDPWLICNGTPTTLEELGVEVPAWQNKVVSELFSADKRGWEETKISQFLDPITCQKILEVKIRPQGEGNDRLRWQKDRYGRFTVKSAYQFLHSKEEVGQSSSCNPITLRQIWKTPTPAYIQLFLWKMYMQVLPMGATLAEKHMIGDFTCPFCAKEQETAEHIFYKCEWVRTVWFGSQLGMKVHKEQQVSVRERLDQAVRWSCSTNNERRLAGTHIMFMLHQIWQARNGIKFDNKMANREGIIRKSRGGAEKCFLAYREESTNPPPFPNTNLKQIEADFCSIPNESIIIRFDASFCRNTGWAGAGAVATDDEGCIVGAAVRRFKALEAAEAELEGAEVAALLAKQLGQKDFVLQGDNKEVIGALHTSECRWEWEGVKTCITAMLAGSKSFVYRWISRSFNRDADELAAWARRQLESSDLPSCLVNANCYPMFV